MSENSPFREYSQYVGLGIQLALAVIVFYFVGKWVDDKYQTTPWFSLVGILLGSTGGFISFFRKVMEKNR
ncbi:MAG: AtpZ/AtpI family protein [Ignavibacteriales bacterium]|nr:AtpZ/AtpI family protein [Ignavibacteriales bacterium]